MLPHLLSDRRKAKPVLWSRTSRATYYDDNDLIHAVV